MWEGDKLRRGELTRLRRGYITNRPKDTEKEVKL